MATGADLNRAASRARSLKKTDLVVAFEPTGDADAAGKASPISELETLIVPSDAEIGDKAFSNPPTDLTAGEQAAARNAIGAGTGTGGGGGPLTDGSVTTAKLADGSVTTPKLADDAVIGRKIAADSVATAHLHDNAVTSAKIPSNAIGTRHIEADSIERGQMRDDSVGTPELVNASVTEAKLAAAVRTKINATSGEQRVLIDVPASEATRDKIIVEDSQLYTTIDRVVHEATANQATYESVRFDLGYFSDESALDATFYRVGRFYYNFAKYTPRVVAYVSGNSGPKHWVDGDAATLVANITGDVGHFASDDEATPHVAAVGNVYFHERLRTYRRVAMFTAGSGAVTQPQRLRQANEDDLAALDNAAVDRLEFVVTPAPASLDVNDLPGAVEVNVTVETNKWEANTLRLGLLGSTTDVAFNPANKKHNASIPVTPAMRVNAGLAVTGSSPTFKTTLTAQILQDNTELASTNFVMRVEDGVTGDLVNRTADLRVVPPVQSWDTATGTGVGVAISTSIVSDLSTLTFTPTATVPSNATVGDEIYYYIAVPTDSLNLSDWRLNLGGFATHEGPSWGTSIGTVGNNSVFQRAYGVGDGSGGVASGTAPGATITLQHHGTTPHTAYSGELEGRALAQVRAEVGPSSGLNRAQVDARIAPYARATPSGQIADAQIPAAITRDSELDARIPAAAAGRIPSAGGTAGQVWKKGPNNEAADWRADQGGAATLTQEQQIGLLKFTPSPPTVQHVHADEFTGTSFDVLVDSPELLTGDVWYDRRIAGNVLGGGNRTKWTSTTFSISFPVPDSSTLRDQLLNGIGIGGGGILLSMRFYDAATGGNVIDVIRVAIGGAAALGTAPVATKALYDGIRTKRDNRLYYWPDHQRDAKRVPGGIAVGGNILARNERLTAAQVEQLLRRSPTAFYTIPDAGTLTWDLDSGFLAQVTLGGAPRNFQPLVNAAIGDELILRVVQDATGGRVITWHGDYKFIGGAAPLDSAANAVTWLRLTVVGANEVLVGYLQPSAGTGGGGEREVASVQLGQPNLAESNANMSGVLAADGGTTGRFAYAVASGQPDSGEQNVRWNPNAADHSIPEGASYAPATGILTLPAGTWRIEAVVALEIRQSASQPAAISTLAGVIARLYEGGELRYAESDLFFGQVGDQPVLSVSGSLVVPEGRTDTVQIRLLTIATRGGTPYTVITNAHLEAFKINVGAKGDKGDKGDRGVPGDTPDVQTLTDQATIAWNVANGVVADVTLAGNRTLAAPTGGSDGQMALLRAKQDSTGGRTLALAASIDTGDRAAPELSTAAGALDFVLLHRIGNTWAYLGVLKHG